MPRTRAAKEPVVSTTTTTTTKVVGVDVSCQTDDWEEDRLRKYRAMKRKLIELISRKNEYQTTLDKANKRIQTLEKKTRQLQQKRTVSKKNQEDDDAMDISQPEEEEESEGTQQIIEEEEIEEEEEEEEEDQLDEDDDVLPTVVKKKRLSRKRRVEIPRDANGNIELPFQVASLNIISLGEVDTERAQYHNDRYIFPIGYTAERTYMSMIDPSNQTTYTCKVEDGGEGPLFTLSAADAPEIELSARTATGVWALVIKRANEARQKESSNAISGPEYYGFSNPVVIEMIEELEGVDQCSRYKRRHKP